MSNVVALADNLIPGQANPDIVEDLEQLLDEARRGELTAYAVCAVYADAKKTAWCGNAGTRDALASTIIMLQARYAQRLLEDGAE